MAVAVDAIGRVGTDADVAIVDTTTTTTATGRHSGVMVIFLYVLILHDGS